MVTRALTLYAPISGRTVALATVPDPVFSQGMVGDGIAIDPQGSEVRAPVDGRVEVLFPTGHAVALRTPDGLEILVHVGIESVKLRGIFQAHVAVGDTVRRGDLLMTFDLAALRAQAVSPLSPVVLASLPDGLVMQPPPVDSLLRAGEDLLLCVVEGSVMTPPGAL